MVGKRKNATIFEIYKKRVFELLFNTAASFPEKDVITWFIVFIEWVQLTWFPLRRTVFNNIENVV